jgi:hypothetical protein
MSGMLLIHRLMRGTKIAQDAPGTILSRGVATPVPPFSSPYMLREGFRDAA